ncbi:MAG: DUF2225 domain-containing protein [Selenomonadaceae bacterium]|nr:DUF2225 domain-containing protein [Selenomonadaceae bacterium]
MTKEEFLQFLRDPEVCKEIFEIVKKGGKPAVPAQPQIVSAPQIQPTPQPVQPAQQKFSSIADKLRFTFKRGDDASKQPQQSPTQPPQPTQPTKEESPKGSGSLADKLKFLRGHLNKAEEERLAAEVAAKLTDAARPSVEKFTVITQKHCPICEKNFRIVKPKMRLNVEKRDLDYCVHYKDFDPYLYTVFTCEHCGFAADEKRFSTPIPNKIKESLREFLKQNDMKLPFIEERTVEDALALFELAILFSELTDHSKGRQAILNLNAAWLCRCEGLADKERDLMEQAAENFAVALDNERWPINGITLETATYLCAAIHFMIGDYDKATSWLSKIMNNSNLRASAPKLFEQARDMWQDIKRVNKV